VQYRYRPHYRAVRSQKGQFGPLQGLAGRKVMRALRETDLVDRPEDLHPVTYQHDAYGYRTPFGLGESQLIALSSSFFITPGLPTELTFAGRLAALTGSGVYNLAQGGWPDLAMLTALDQTLARAGHPMTVVYGALIVHFSNFSRGAFERHPDGRWKPEESEHFRSIAVLPPPKLPLGLLAGTLFTRRDAWIPPGTSTSHVVSTWHGRDASKFFRDRAEVPNPRLYTWGKRSEPLFFLDERVWPYFNNPFESKTIDLWLTKLDAVLQRHNSRLIMMVIPFKYAVMAPFLGDQIPREELIERYDVNPKTIPPGASPCSVLDWNYHLFLTELTAQAAQHNFGVVDLLPTFRQNVAQGGLPFFRYDTHWNEQGIEIAAQAVSRFLADGNWMPPPAGG
jgi:hypothetical protein